MTLDEIHDDLEAIAKKHVGPLNEEAVRWAPRILEMPRYAQAVNGPALLVADLKHVIGEIPDYPSPSKKNEPWYSNNFRTYAKRFFSLEAAGEGFTQRITFGREKEPAGTAKPWMTRGVLYRVAAGLLTLWSDASGVPESDASAHLGAGYTIDKVYVARETRYGRLGPQFTDIFHYSIRLITPGPYVLPLSCGKRYTRLRMSNGLDQELVAVLDNGQSKAAIVFGSQGQPQEPIDLHIERKPPTVRKLAETELYSVSFVVSQPIGRLFLDLMLLTDPEHEYEWRVGGPGTDLPYIGKEIKGGSGLVYRWYKPTAGTYRLYSSPRFP